MGNGFEIIKDSEVLSNEMLNEIEGADCSSCSKGCTQSCKQKKSTTSNGNDNNGNVPNTNLSGSVQVGVAGNNATMSVTKKSTDGK